MSTKENAIEMFVGGLVLDPNTQAPVVILKNEEGTRTLPIWIGIAEATSIASVIKQLELDRPLTHDLMYELLVQLEAEVQQVVITDLKDSTYFAELILTVGDRVVIVDCRPSDAIALALRAEAAISVAESVLEKAKIATVVSDDDPIAEAADSGAAEGAEAGEANEPLDEEEDVLVAEHADFNAIDKDKWNELLKDLDPDDFKHKM